MNSWYASLGQFAMFSGKFFSSTASKASFNVAS